MLEDLEPYPEYQISHLNPNPMPKTARYTMCAALRDIYLQTTDPEIKLKLRYIATLAKAVTDKLSEIDPGWLHSMYPRVMEYDKLMRKQEV